MYIYIYFFTLYNNIIRTTWTKIICQELDNFPLILYKGRKKFFRIYSIFPSFSLFSFLSLFFPISLFHFYRMITDYHPLRIFFSTSFFSLLNSTIFLLIATFFFLVTKIIFSANKKKIEILDKQLLCVCLA